MSGFILYVLGNLVKLLKQIFVFTLYYVLLVLVIPRNVKDLQNSYIWIKNI